MKRAALTLLLFCLTLPLVLSADKKQDAKKREMRMRSTVKVSSRFVQLKDLISDTALLSDKEKELIIFDAPLRGHKNWSTVKILRLMQDHKELLDIDVWASRIIKVVRIADKDFVEKVKTKVLDTLRAKPQWKDSTIDIEFTPDDLSAINEMSGSDTIELLSQNATTSQATIQLRVKFSSNKQALGTISLKPLLRREIELVTLKISRGKGHILKNSDLLVSKTWSYGHEQKYASTLNECIGYEIRKNIAEGERVLRNLLAPPIYAERDQILNAHIFIGALKVSVEVKALEQGRRGETIRVRNTKSRKLLDVLLVAPGLAEVK